MPPSTTTTTHVDGLPDVHHVHAVRGVALDHQRPGEVDQVDHLVGGVDSSLGSVNMRYEM